MLHYPASLQQIYLMQMIHYQINTRELTAFQPLSHELIDEPDKNYLFDLSYLTGIDITGERGQEFLQGQLSCDTREVSPHQMRQGAMCNLKGRILALLDVINWQGLRLILPTDLLTDTMRSLAKTALFSQVKLSPSTTYRVLGFHLRNNQDIIPFNRQLPTERQQAIYDEAYYCYHLGDNFYIFLVHHNAISLASEAFINLKQWRGSLAWHALQLQQHQVDIYPQSRGLFLPHRLGLHLSGHISFNKGCYKGQEIIARTHYRAKLKHEMKLFTIQSDQALESGQLLFNANNKTEIGELVDFCPIGNETYLIAVSVIFDNPESVMIGDRVVILR